MSDWTPATFKKSVVGLVARYGYLNWTLADQAVVSIANFLTGIIVARYLGIAAFGVFSLCWLIVQLAQSFQFAMIVTPMMTVGPKIAADKVRGYYASVLFQQFIFSSASSVVVYGIVIFGAYFGLGADAHQLAVPVALAVFCSQVFEFLRRFSFTIGRPDVALRADIVRYVLQISVLWIVLAKMDAGSVARVLEVTALMALVAIIAFIFSAPSVRFSREQLIETYRRHWKLSKWLVAAAVLQWTSGNYFIIAAGATLGPTAVGALKAAQNLIGVTHVFFQAADNIVPVRAAKIYAEKGDVGLDQFVRKLLLIGGIGTIAASLVLALPAKIWLTLLFGASYAPYAYIVGWFAVAYFLMAMAIPYRYACVARESSSPVFWGYVIATIFALLAAKPMIAQFGLSGVITGLIITQIIMLTNFYVRYVRERRS